MAKLKIKQVKSTIKQPSAQKKTMEALGFKRMNQVLEQEDSPALRGMINQVSHLVEIIE